MSNLRYNLFGFYARLRQIRIERDQYMADPTIVDRYFS